jgi:DnaJ family protein C protein 11
MFANGHARFSRLGQSISVPILLSHNLNPYVVLCSTVIPAASYAALYHLYILPRKRRRIAEYVFCSESVSLQSM